MYGEHYFALSPIETLYGSSPCVRGTFKQGRHFQVLDRFIPVCTGNIPAPHRTTRDSPVHPRVYGEHDCNTPTPCPANGSSPCVRGTFEIKPPCKPSCRFIPVCTGNILLSWTNAELHPVHPRVYGEHAPDCQTPGLVGGSSPCVRGTYPAFRTSNSSLRFIPVCTGNISFLYSAVSRISVHPRVYGEHPTLDNVARDATGSSPCVRGTYPKDCDYFYGGRFIPVCTGNILDQA